MCLLCGYKRTRKQRMSRTRNNGNHTCHTCKDAKLEHDHHSGDKDRCSSYKIEYNFQMDVSGQQGEKILTRDEYYDGVANNMVLQKYFDPKNYSLVAKTIFPKYAMDRYEKRQDQMKKDFKK